MGERCCAMTYDMREPVGRLATRARNASSPPAEAPMPTTRRRSGLGGGSRCFGGRGRRQLGDRRFFDDDAGHTGPRRLTAADRSCHGSESLHPQGTGQTLLSGTDGSPSRITIVAMAWRHGNCAPLRVRRVAKASSESIALQLRGPFEKAMPRCPDHRASARGSKSGACWRHDQGVPGGWR